MKTPSIHHLDLPVVFHHRQYFMDSSIFRYNYPFPPNFLVHNTHIYYLTELLIFIEHH